MRSFVFAASCAALLSMAGASAADTKRDAMFLALVKERTIPPVDKAIWGRRVGADAIWVGSGLRVARRDEIEAVQIDTGKRVEIQEFEVHDYGDTAVLSYIVVEEHPQGANTTTLRLRKLDTYVRQGERWQLVANAEVVGKPDRKAVTLDVDALDRLAGTYETMLDGKPIRTRVWREGTRLYAQTEGQEKGELMPLGPTSFFDAAEPQEGGPENIFVLGADGRATQWIWRNAGVEFPARRLPD
jgi:hypothetical protein